MGLIDWVTDKIEDARDYVDKNITGNYNHFEYCQSCGKTIDTKYGIGNNFRCPHCGLILCKGCADEKIVIETEIFQHPALFKKGRRQHREICPKCEYVIHETDIEIFRKGE